MHPVGNGDSVAWCSVLGKVAGDLAGSIRGGRCSWDLAVVLSLGTLGLSATDGKDDGH